MQKTCFFKPGMLLAVAGLLGILVTLCGAPSVAVGEAEDAKVKDTKADDAKVEDTKADDAKVEDTKADDAKPEKKSTTESKVKDSDRVPLAVARDRAKIMHDVYSATLDVIHHRYFHGERAMVPARAMEDVFKGIKRDSGVEAQWISVNTKAMSIDHEPKSDFEKRASREIAAGKPEFEVIEGGYYRRAGAISLNGGCTNCHVGFFRESSSAPRFAGLIISVPVVEEPAKSE